MDKSVFQTLRATRLPCCQMPPAARLSTSFGTLALPKSFLPNPCSEKIILNLNKPPISTGLPFGFDGVRTTGFETVSAEHWKGVTRFRLSNGDFGFEFTYRQLEHLIANNQIAAQSMLSLGHKRYLLAPHWKNRSDG